MVGSLLLGKGGILVEKVVQTTTFDTAKGEMPEERRLRNGTVRTGEQMAMVSRIEAISIPTIRAIIPYILFNPAILSRA
ncbi:hypothetical protein Sj15T_25070 [Sphingobium sp. TA15]|nr:hypothetical protein Sj15T_25070 [Sphingobium sp. TA15]